MSRSLSRRAFATLAVGVASVAASGAPNAFAAAAPPSPSPSTPPVARDRRFEAQALRLFAEQTHPEGPRAALDPGWRSQAEAFVKSADSLSDSAYPVAAMRLLAWFKDGHTGVYVPELRVGEWGLRLPIGREIFADGIYVTSAKEEGLPLLGARIARVGGRPVEAIVRQFAEMWPSAGPVLAHRWSLLLFSSPAFLHAFGVVQGPPDAPVLIEGIMPDGRVVSASLLPRADGARDRENLVRAFTPLEIFARTRQFGPQSNPAERGQNFVWQIGARTTVISLDRMGPDDFGKPFAIFEAEASKVLESGRSSRLIVDLRRNGGGDNMLCESLRKGIARSRFNRPGGLYVLIAPHTFSAAQNLANRLERETFAYFIGEPTGSSPNHCGDSAQLPHAEGGLPASVSTVRWMDSSPFDKRSTIMPDLIVPQLWRNYVAGKDAALEAAMAHVDVRSCNAAQLTAPWERPSQLQAWKPYWL